MRTDIYGSMVCILSIIYANFTYHQPYIKLRYLKYYTKHKLYDSINCLCKINS